MDKAILGNTGLKVSRLGAGLAAIGQELTLDDIDQAGRLLNAALDGGINFLDTSANYLVSEELVGRTIAHRRREYILSTKCGYNDEKSALDKWTAQLIEEHIDNSLKKMRTDYLDLVLLHTCDVVVLERGEVIEALLKARSLGKTRFVGYSGDNEAAFWAVDSGLFDVLQTSFSIVDQRARAGLFGAAKTKDMGVIVKRPIANGAWGAERNPTADLRYVSNRSYGDEYFRRAQAMAQMGPLPGAPDDRFVTAIGFVLAHPEVDTAIVGTHNPLHMTDNIERVNRELPIPSKVVDELHRRFDRVGADWAQRT